MSFEPKATDFLSDEFVVVIGVFAPREYEVARERYPSLTTTTFESYAKDMEALARSMSAQGAEVEICVLDIEDFDDWCLESSIDPDRTDSRARYVATFKPETYAFDSSIMRVFDCEYAAYLAYLAYDDALNIDEIEDCSSTLEEQCTLLMNAVGESLLGKGLVSVEAVIGDGSEEFGMSFVVQMDDERDLCLVHESDHAGLSAMLHLGLLRGGTVFVRELRGGGCTLQGYDLGTRQWARGSAADVAAWRGNRDDSVVTAGGVLTLRAA
jgi:hypothetical protein